MPSINCICLQPPDPNRRASKELDKKIAVWMKQYRKSIKLLLLGAGESGKTTIIKQMRILHVQGFSAKEREEKAKEIRKNLFVSIKELTNSMSILKPPINIQDSNNQISFEFVGNLQIDEIEDYDFPDNFYDHIKRVWTDSGIQECYRRSDEFPLIDCAKYFLDKIDVIKETNYIPSDQDILFCRRRTDEIQKIEFEVKIPIKYGGGVQNFWMFDVGGQRGERRKWIQVFDGITAVVFLAACSEFNMKIREDNQTNRLVESLKLFQDVWKSKFLRDSGFILFLNKQDLLELKIRRGDKLEDHFPDFAKYKPNANDGDANDDYIRARCFIRDMFLEVTKKPAEHRKFSTGENVYYDNINSRKNRECFVHFTTATDTNNIKKVFDDVHTMIILMNLQQISLT